MSGKAASPRRPNGASPPPWAYALALASALVAALEAYAPALRGPFVFDDLTLPFASGAAADATLGWWVNGVRPLLMLSYWFDHQSSAGSTLSFHLGNVLLHVLNAALVFMILRRLLAITEARAQAALLTALGGAAVFLLHPIQAESVAYIAGRSEVLSASFVLAALCIYIPRALDGLSWRAAIAIALLFAAAAATKEQAVATLPACLVLTDLIVCQMGPLVALRRNRRLYLALLGPGVLAAVYVWRILASAPSVGAALADVVRPDQYFYTQCRAIWVYIRLLVLPYGQTADHDFAISETIASGGAWLGLLALVVLVERCVRWRRRYPLFSYGVLLFLALLAPTSSFLPLADPLVEHRLYLPMLGLLIAAAGWVAGLRVRPAALAFRLAGIVLVCGLLTANRAAVWSDPVVFWQDVVAKSPRKARPYPHLLYSYMLANRCGEAVEHLERVSRDLPRDYLILLNWAQAYDCAGKPRQALEKIAEAALLEGKPEVFAFQAQLLERSGERERAIEALRKAGSLQPLDTELGYVYRGQLLQLDGLLNEAEEAFQKALVYNPRSPEALAGLRQIVAQRVRSDEMVSRSRTP